MARPREFDTNEALLAAMNSFWEHGYESTSVSELLEAMNLQKGSLYKAFGSKHELFLEALKIYINELLQHTRHLFQDQPTATAAISAWVNQKVEMCNIDKDGKGCLFMNTLIEKAAEDEEIHKIQISAMKKMKDLLVEQILRGQESGEFRKDVEADSLAALLILHAQGIYVCMRGKVDFLKEKNPTELVLDILKK